MKVTPLPDGRGSVALARNPAPLAQNPERQRRDETGQFTVTLRPVGAAGPLTVPGAVYAPAAHAPVGRVSGTRVFPLLVSLLRLAREPVARLSRFAPTPIAGDPDA